MQTDSLNNRRQSDKNMDRYINKNMDRERPKTMETQINGQTKIWRNRKTKNGQQYRQKYGQVNKWKSITRNGQTNEQFSQTNKQIKIQFDKQTCKLKCRQTILQTD